jgi:hypothetical protein
LRGTNITATFPFRAFYNTTTSKRVQYISKNKMSAML